MKAFLLAAGEGRRLRPLTERVPKCLVPIGGTPLLGIWLQMLEAAGVTDALVNTHYLAAEVDAFLRAWPTSIRVTTAYEPRLLGSAGTVLANRAFVDGSGPFFVIYADNLSTMDLGRMARFHDERGAVATIGIVPTDRPREKGVVVLDADDRILAFEEKVAHPRSNLSNAGVYVAGQALFDYLPETLPPDPLDFGYHVLPRIVPSLVAYRIHELMTDIGTPEAYAAAQAAWAAARAARPEAIRR